VLVAIQFIRRYLGTRRDAVGDDRGGE